MNLDYITNHIIPTRKREIEAGKHMATRQPIYVVLDLVEHICSGHSDYTSATTLNSSYSKWEYGYIDTHADVCDVEFSDTPDGMEEPEEVTRFYTDRVVAFFLTSEDAHAYLQYQSHNLDIPYVYVFYSGYQNHHMDTLLEGT